MDIDSKTIVDGIFGICAKCLDDLRFMNPNCISDIDKLIDTNINIPQAIFNSPETEKTIDDYLAEHNLIIEKSSNLYFQIKKDFAKRYAEICALEKERKAGNYLNPYDIKDSLLFNPKNTQDGNENKKENPPASPKHRISKLIEQYIKEKVESGRWREKTETDSRYHLKVILEIIGDVYIEDIDYHMISDYRSKLRNLPPNATNISKRNGSTILSLIENNKEKTLSVRTFNMHLGTIQSFFKWANIHGYIKNNPAQQLTDKIDRKPSEEHKIYEKEDILKILQKIKEQKNRRPERYWIPLISMFSGARINELAQLDTADIAERDGYWCMDINDNAPQKHVKNAYSRRIVPIHPVVIELGFIDYVKKSRTKKLWPKLIYNSKNFYAHLIQKWFGVMNRKFVTKDPKKTFKSLRHYVSTFLKTESLQPVEVTAEILGHEIENQTYGRYGKAYKIDTLYNTISQIKYFDIDIISSLKE